MKRRKTNEQRPLRGIEYFKELGQLVERRWRRHDYNESTFPDIAHAALAERPAHVEVDPKEILDWVLSDAEMPEQLDPDGEFGQPPVTLYHSAGFVIDVLYWLDSTTSIHDHSFSGAFQVLSGGSVHGVWTFAVDDAVSLGFQIGRIDLDDMELLAPGDCRRIIAGRRLVHSLFHLERPSVSVVVRTHEQQNALPQYQYRRPHLAIAPLLTNARARRRLQALAVIREADSKGFTRTFHRALRELDLPTVFEAIRRFTRVHERDELDAALAIARQRHGVRVDRFVPVLQEEYRQKQIISRRQHIHTAEHRFFLALLLNAPDRRYILQLVAARLPHAKPIDTIHRWVTELAQMPSLVDAREPNAIGVPLAHDGLALLRYILDDKSLPAIMKRLAREYDGKDLAAQAPTIAHLFQAWREYPLFRTLFTKAGG